MGSTTHHAAGWLEGIELKELSDEAYFLRMRATGCQIRRWDDRYIGLMGGAIDRDLPRRCGFRDIFHMAAIQARLSRKKVTEILRITRAIRGCPGLWRLFTHGRGSLDEDPHPRDGGAGRLGRRAVQAGPKPDPQGSRSLAPGPNAGAARQPTAPRRRRTPFSGAGRADRRRGGLAGGRGDRGGRGDAPCAFRDSRDSCGSCGSCRRRGGCGGPCWRRRWRRLSRRESRLSIWHVQRRGLEVRWGVLASRGISLVRGNARATGRRASGGGSVRRVPPFVPDR
jgi:hypothetical protein